MVSVAVCYRTSVVRLMQMGTTDEARSSRTIGDASIPPRREPSHDGGFGPLAERLRQRERNASACADAPAASLVAGLVATLILSPVAFGVDLLPVRAIGLMTVTYAWPLVLILAMVATLTPRQTFLTAGPAHPDFSPLIAAWIAVAPAQRASPAPSNAWQSVPTVLQALVFWGGTQLIPTIATVLVLNRWVKAVGPLMLVFSLLAVTILHAALRYTLDDSGFTALLVLVWGAIEMRGWPYPPFVAPQILAGLGLALIVGVPIGWLINRWMARRYRHKREFPTRPSSPTRSGRCSRWRPRSRSFSVAAGGPSPVSPSSPPTRAPLLPRFLVAAPAASISRPRAAVAATVQRWTCESQALRDAHLAMAVDWSRPSVWRTGLGAADRRAVPVPRFPGRSAEGALHHDRFHTRRADRDDRCGTRPRRALPGQRVLSGGARVWRPAVSALIRRSHLTVMDLRGLAQRSDTGVKDELFNPGGRRWIQTPRYNSRNRSTSAEECERCCTR